MKKGQPIRSAFKALGDETRLRLFLLLKEHAFCVGALSQRLSITQSAVSQHLRVLKEAGLVAPKRMGSFIHYRIENASMRKLSDDVKNLLAPGSGSKAGGKFKQGEKQCARKSKSARSRKS